MDKNNNNNNKPKHFLVLKIVGFIGLFLTITGLILIFTGFGDFSTNNFMIGGFVFMAGFSMSFYGLIFGFSPELAKLKTKTTKYIQQENKEDLKDIVDTSADISSDAITKTTRAIKKGFKDTMFCKHCGAEIDEDSTFCKKCGKKQ